MTENHYKVHNLEPSRDVSTEGLTHIKADKTKYTLTVLYRMKVRLAGILKAAQCVYWKENSDLGLSSVIEHIGVT